MFKALLVAFFNVLVENYLIKHMNGLLGLVVKDNWILDN